MHDDTIGVASGKYLDRLAQCIGEYDRAFDESDAEFRQRILRGTFGVVLNNPSPAPMPIMSPQKTEYCDGI